MQLTDIALNSLRRRKGRMIFLVLGLAIGVATVVALVAITDTMQTDIAVKMDEYGANILIVPKASDLSLSYGGVTVASAAYDVGELSLADLDRLQTIPNARNISVVAPKLLGAITLGERPVLVAGVRFPDELRLKQWWQLNGAEPGGTYDALAGVRLAQALNLHAGAMLKLNGQTFHVVGILAENGTQDDDILFIDLAAAQQVMNKPDGISLVEVAALCIACPVEDMVKQISEVLPQARVTALRQAVTLRMETVGQLGRFALAVAAVVMAIGGMVVLTTMLSSVSERRPEIGLFRAMGFRQQHVMRIILSEAALVSMAGGVLGWLAGMGAAVLLTPYLANVTIPVQWNPWWAFAAAGGALVIGLGASVYPAMYAARLDPTIALRSL
ncbi:MAG: ABC transporter permease [Anaerolineales bacterium]|nr:ABC transporter permease [Anaerolineales bacterium]